MLKTRRIEYTLEYFKNMERPKTMKERSDIVFMNEMRFQMTRLLSVSKLMGMNCLLLFYIVGGFHERKMFIALPLLFAAYQVSTNLMMKNCMDSVYYPIRPLYK